MQDLWPTEIGRPRQTAPVAILRRQAALLTDKTHGVVTAHLEIAKASPGSAGARNDMFAYRFVLVAPHLDSYRLPLFVLSHSADLYPVHIHPEGYIRPEVEDIGMYNGTAPIKADNEAQLNEVLGVLFHLGTTRKIIRALLAQSEAYAPDADNTPP
jgi:hypothetical protein